MDFVEYVVTGPSGYEYIEYAAETVGFLAGGFQTFIVPIAWTLPEYIDSTGVWIGQLIWDAP